jgi:hypothetical protein
MKLNELPAELRPQAAAIAAYWAARGYSGIEYYAESGRYLRTNIRNGYPVGRKGGAQWDGK